MFKKPEAYKILGRISDTIFSELKQKVLNIDKARWSLEDERKKIAPEQMATDTIFFINKADPNSPFPKLRNSFYHPDIIDHINPEFFSVVESIANFYGGGEIKRAVLAKLSPYGNVLPHRDIGHFLTVNNRIHLPILTNDQVSFIVNDLVVPMQEGMLVEINNNKSHEVKNFSSECRIHLIVDWGEE